MANTVCSVAVAGCQGGICRVSIQPFTLMTSKPTNAASGFLIMAVFNFVAAIVFIVLYLLTVPSEDFNRIWFLVAGLIELVATIALFFAYRHFKEKLARL